MDVVLDNASSVTLAFAYTVLLFVIAGVLSLIGGTVLVAMRVGPVRVLNVVATGYISLVRNTPLLIVLFFFRLAGPRIGLTWSFVDIDFSFDFGTIRLNNIFAACIVGLTVYTSAFVCEALRAGVNAVPLGQAEAARAIGLPFGGVMREVVLPQAFKAALPPLTSVQIALLKNTTVAGAVGVFEAFNRMRSLTNDNATARVEIFLSFALIFIVLVEVLSLVGNQLERRGRIAR